MNRAVVTLATVARQTKGSVTVTRGVMVNTCHHTVTCVSRLGDVLQGLPCEEGRVGGDDAVGEGREERQAPADVVTWMLSGILAWHGWHMRMQHSDMHACALWVPVRSA